MRICGVSKHFIRPDMFDSPEEYLNFLQTSLKGEFTIKGEIPEGGFVFNPEFAHLFPKEYSERIYRTIEERGPERITAGDDTMQHFWQELQQDLPKETVDKVLAKVAIGGMYRQLPYARIFKSPEGFLCICINNDFFRAVNTLFNYIEAIANPQNVRHYSGGEGFTSEDYYNDLLLFISTAKNNGYILPVLIFFNTEGLMVTATNTGLAMKFVMCHEIAHFLNGDFDDKTAFSLAGSDETQGEVLEKNISVEKEYKADRLAYDLLAEYVLPKNDIPLGENILIYNMDRLFHLMLQMGVTNSTEHPHPVNRCLALIDRYVERGNDVSFVEELLIENLNMLQNIQP